MKPPRSAWDRWIGLLLFSFPPRFRRRFGAELAEQYPPPRERRLRAALEAGRDLSRAGLGARVDDLRAAPAVRSGSGADGLRVDLADVVRGLRRRPLFAVTVTATLALAAGLNAAVFGFLDNTLLRPLPVRDEATIVSIGNEWHGFEHSAVSVAEYLDYVERSRTLRAVSAFVGASFNLAAENGVPERLLGARVTASFFDVLGVRPMLGRTFTSNEDRPGASTVVVLSHGLWMRRFGGDPDVINRTLPFDSGSYRILGVMPAEFQFPAPDTELWIPLSINPAAVPSRGNHNRRVLARIADGYSVRHVQQEMNTIARQFAEEHPSDYPAGSGWGLSVRPLREQLVGDFRLALQTLMAAVAFVLLIACANVTNLMVARASERQNELATRAALGASGFRLARQALLEGLVLGLCGGVVGLALGTGLVAALQSVLPSALSVPGRLFADPRVAAFALTMTAATGIVAALTTAARALKPSPDRVLRAGRASADRVSQRMRGMLTVTEIALAVMLLVAAGVAIRSFVGLIHVNPGIRTSGVTTARVTALTKYREAADLAGYLERLCSSLASRPGVTHAGIISVLPMSGVENDRGFEVDGYVPPRPGLLANEQERSIGGDYFQAMGIPLVEGRLFDTRDVVGGPPVAIVSVRVARKYWGDGNAIGGRIRFYGGQVWTTVVGIVGDIRTHGLDADFNPIVYVPATQLPERSMTLVASLAPGVAGAAMVSEAVRDVDPQQPIFAMRMMDEWIAQSVAAPRFSLTLLILFAALAVALAGIGVYGVVAYNVARRTRELGIRLALGARPSELLTLVLGRSLTMTTLGVAAGLAAGLTAAASLGSIFHGARTLDPTVLAAVVVLVLGVSLAASYIPARRAMRVDPAEALRAE